MFALLDLDETLVDRSSAFSCWADQFARRLRLGQDEREWLSTTDQQHKQRDAFFERVHARFPQTGPPQALWDEYAAVLPTFARPHDGVLEILTQMRTAGWKSVVVTNGRRDTQEAKLHATGLAPLVDGWVISGAAGVRKPEPEIFLRALHLLAAPDPAQVVMVEDDPHADIEPATALGLKTAWVSYGRAWPLPGRPDITADTTAALLRLVASPAT